MPGQLDSIGVMISKVGEKSPDPAVGQLAGAIAKMADSAKAASVTPSSDVDLRVLYEGVGLDNRTIAASSPGKAIRLSDFQILNEGDHATDTVSLRLYFSQGLFLPASWNGLPVGRGSK